MASHWSTTWRGQPMEFAPSLRAWGNVPSARHRHNVRRLTPTRSSTSGTRNMASVETLGDIQLPPQSTSTKTTWSPGWPAWVSTASGTATVAVPESPTELRPTIVGTGRCDLVVMGPWLRSRQERPGTFRNARECTRAGWPSRRPDRAHHGQGGGYVPATLGASLSRPWSLNARVRGPAMGRWPVVSAVVRSTIGILGRGCVRGRSWGGLAATRLHFLCRCRTLGLFDGQKAPVFECRTARLGGCVRNFVYRA